MIRRDGLPPQEAAVKAQPAAKPRQAPAPTRTPTAPGPEARIASQAAKQVGKPKDPNPSRAEIRAILRETADRLGIPREILMAIAFKESTWRHYAKDGTVLRGRWSPSDVGIMQINEKAHPNAFPQAAKDMRYNIEYGARYLKYQYERYGNWDEAIAAYNYGSARRNKKGRLLNQSYVDRVDRYMVHFKADPDSLPTM